VVVECGPDNHGRVVLHLSTHLPTFHPHSALIIYGLIIYQNIIHLVPTPQIAINANARVSIGGMWCRESRFKSRSKDVCKDSFTTIVKTIVKHDLRLDLRHTVRA